MSHEVDKIMSDAKKVFSDQLWEMNLDSLSNAKRKVVKFIKLMRITLDSFASRRMGFQCVALSYFGALSTIPLAAVIFTVTGGLGIADKIDQVIYSIVPADPVIMKTLMEKAGNIIDAAKSGTVGLVSALFFIWTIIWLMFQVERVFNNVWDIRKVPRKIYKRFSFYIGALLILPFVVIIFCSGIAIYSNATFALGINFKEASAIAKLLGWFIIYLLTVVTLSAMYKWIPAVKVKYKYALASAVVDALIFTLFQYFYLETQVFVSRLNAVYGVIAAIPLFLIWMNFSWQIVIYGAHLCYGLHNIDSYNIPEGKLKDFTPLLDRLHNNGTEENNI